MKISIGCDHAGYEYKDNIVKYLEKQGHSKSRSMLVDWDR